MRDITRLDIDSVYDFFSTTGAEILVGEDPLHDRLFMIELDEGEVGKMSAISIVEPNVLTELDRGAVLEVIRRVLAKDSESVVEGIRVDLVVQVLEGIMIETELSVMLVAVHVPGYTYVQSSPIETINNHRYCQVVPMDYSNEIIGGLVQQQSIRS